MLSGCKTHIRLEANPVMPGKCQMDLTYWKMNYILIYQNHKN